MTDCVAEATSAKRALGVHPILESKEAKQKAIISSLALAALGLVGLWFGNYSKKGFGKVDLASGFSFILGLILAVYCESQNIQSVEEALFLNRWIALKKAGVFFLETSSKQTYSIHDTPLPVIGLQRDEKDNKTFFTVVSVERSSKKGNMNLMLAYDMKNRAFYQAIVGSYVISTSNRDGFCADPVSGNEAEWDEVNLPNFSDSTYLRVCGGSIKLPKEKVLLCFKAFDQALATQKAE